MNKSIKQLVAAMKGHSDTTKESMIRELVCEVIDSIIELSRLKWSAGESGALRREDGEILKENLK